MKLTKTKLRSIIREETRKLVERKVAVGEEGGYFKVRKGTDGTVVIDVGSDKEVGERRVKLLPGEAQNLASTLEQLQKV